MATRVGGDSPVFVPPPGVSADNRSDQRREQMLKELVDMQLVRSRNEGEHLLDSVVRSLRPPGTNGAPPQGGGLRVAPIEPPDPRQGLDAPRGAAGPATGDLPRLVAEFQREQGLPVTGRLDPSTVNAMKDRGIIALPLAPAGPAPAPAAGHGKPPVEGAPPKTPPRPEDTGAARQVRNAAEQRLRARVDGGVPARERPSPSTTTGARDARPPPEAERVVDPARLLASLVTAGFVGKKGNLEEGLKSFQATFSLPVTGKLDPQTQEALKSQGHADPEAPPKATTDKPVEKPAEQKSLVRRALSESATSKTVADRDVKHDPVRPQARTWKPTTSTDVAARAPSTAASDAADKARLDTVVARQAATERGVQEATGDPTATRGHGEVKGQGAGQKGQGGAEGGGDTRGAGPGALAPKDGPAGAETAVGNTKAGDDDFLDEARGNANVRDDDKADDADQATLEGEGHWRVPPLSEQARAALEKIARDDDGSGPVTYTWDVTFHRPGVYAAGQPAEELWHVGVHKATAFDPVWQQAADALASRMLYAEPDAPPLTIDDFILALRRARVR